ncbi:Glis family zinc finger 1 protein [Rutstroemia sp. NJR-2017a BBW]|nr:Glis family zinc finger 1 protein [Rutstroemia sp. NJR-2017a BBW]
MDPVRESQGSFNNLFIDEVTYSDEAYWVEAAWRRENAADVSQDGAGVWRDGVGIECVEVHQEEEEDLSGPAESTLETLPEEEGTEGALMTMERRLSCLKTQPHVAQNSCQSTTSNNNRFVVERANFRSSTSRKPYKCDLGCDTSFKWSKDLRRYIKDIHETWARYRCPAGGCKYGGDTAGHVIKRKDNFRRHLQNKHNVDGADFLDIDLEQFLVVV